MRFFNYAQDPLDRNVQRARNDPALLDHSTPTGHCGNSGNFSLSGHDSPALSCASPSVSESRE